MNEYYEENLNNPQRANGALSRGGEIAYRQALQDTIDEVIDIGGIDESFLDALYVLTTMTRNYIERLEELRKVAEK